MYKLLLISLLSPLLCLAEAPFYLGAELGYTDIRQGDFDDDKGYRLYGAYQLNSNISAEVGYADLGSFEIDEDAIAGSVDVENVYDISIAIAGDILQRQGYKTRAEFKAGFYQADIEADLSGGRASSDENGYTTSLSIMQPINDNIDAVFSWRYYDNIEDIDVTTYMIGGRYRF
ncbi:hypothetical protein BST96_09730 [Oceanicoccus sagamiensis]|uniref:Outer membrane protein beta-barrel domain-containing protein n=2 Tax=Oceanicoccus sagamiensis TaxID=716816 RepID=A0A1X9NHJ2_9GAMM|nr:hypothetical protein BST96_09730 [Oceanicoccus sagamiensis]